MNGSLFLTLEGGEGAGKSTAAQFIAQWFRTRGREVVLTREPGGSPLAEAIRGVVLADWKEGVPAESELLLMFAARAAHLDHTIRPALRRGAVVVSDRFVDASWAYQGAGRGLPDHLLGSLESLVLKDTRPDLTLLFDLPPELGLARAKTRGDVNRFEAESLVFQARIREAYLARAAATPDRYCVIDSSRDITSVQTAIGDALERFA